MLNLLFNFIFCLSKYNRTEFLNRKGIFIGSWIEIRCLFVQHEDLYGAEILAPFTPNVCIRFISFTFPKENLLYAFLVSVRIAACPAHPILVDSVILITRNWWDNTNCEADIVFTALLLITLSCIQISSSQRVLKHYPYMMRGALSVHYKTEYNVTRMVRLCT